MNAVDLFAGCGGLTAGLKRAGFRVRLAVELDKHAAASYRLNHREVRLLECDIRKIDLEAELHRLGIAAGELDLLAACPPCQGFSTIRTLNTARRIRDHRNDLVNFVAHLIRIVQPQTLLFENVPGLARQRRFQNFLRELDELGYHCEFDIVDAAEFDVPQRRKRLILLASRVGPIALPQRTNRPRTVRDAISKLKPAGKSGDALHDLKERRSAKVSEIIRLIPKNGGSRSALPAHMVLACHKKSNGFKDVYGRLSWDRPAGTITSGCTNPSKGRFIHPQEDRALTLREAALLQGFPKRYKFAASSKTEIAKQIGNAVPPIFACRQAEQLRSHLANRGA